MLQGPQDSHHNEKHMPKEGQGATLLRPEEVHVRVIGFPVVQWADLPCSAKDTGLTLVQKDPTGQGAIKRMHTLSSSRQSSSSGK